MAWQDEVKKYAPILGGLLTVAGGPAGALAGAALTGIAGALGVPNDPGAIQSAIIAGLTPDQQAALTTADLEYKKAVISAGVQDHQIDADTEKAYIGDTEAARAHNSNNKGIMWLGFLVNFASYSSVMAILIGCYYFVTGSAIKDIDPGALVAIGGIVGSALQWIISNSNQANGYFFGSSPSARINAEQMAQAVSKTTQTIGKKNA